MAQASAITLTANVNVLADSSADIQRQYEFHLLQLAWKPVDEALYAGKTPSEGSMKFDFSAPSSAGYSALSKPPMLSRSPPAGFIAPCLPTPILRPPTGPLWFHEIKHDGYRLMAWREGGDVPLYTRRGYDWSERYPAVVAAMRALRAGSCLIDGELVVCDDAGVSSFERLTIN